MLRSGTFWVGVAAGAVAWWWISAKRGGLVAATPYGPKPLRRDGRRGQSWPGGPAYAQ